MDEELCIHIHVLEKKIQILSLLKIFGLLLTKQLSYMVKRISN